MTKAEFEAILKRGNDTHLKYPKNAQAVMICMKDGKPIHPVELGFAEAKEFEEYCQAVSQAAKDRHDLLKMMIEDFDLKDYFEE